MVFQRRVVVLVSAAIAIVLAGCSQPEAGTAIPDSSGSAMPSSSQTQGDNFPVPHISEPLDPSPYLDDPCGLVPRSFVNNLGYGGAGQASSGDIPGVGSLTGPGCNWGAAGQLEMMSLNFQTEARKRGEQGGLRQHYALYESGDKYAYWEPATVASYPAAFADLADRRNRGWCNLIVGVADDLSFSVATQGHEDDPARACENATALATKVVELLKGGS
ncbi:Protein of unknown function (DUF3558) [Saccharomonospora marina XMU15]|uniref:DUF3558 domain-containing protein n=1 Tax=Saccharomonospora marina XMU15 TaxID=882083 RepID=H5X8X4_9PSEU|nr:DUF3558 domain-containing protein [Saccharomonospora marina]EHR52549.1 Protein of unknown function (DUF3558) [Saccharomonospora marina XMU15]